MQLTIPTSVQEEQEELHAQLLSATEAGGRTGSAARAVARLLHPHFRKEQEYALPPLALLAELARGADLDQLRTVLRLTEKLRDELPKLAQEHQAIAAALRTLAAAANAEHKPEIAAFARKLRRHAVVAEQLIYPAALLVGQYLRLRLAC